MEFVAKYPSQTVGLLIGGGAIAAATGFTRHRLYAIAFICGIVGAGILACAAWTMRDPESGSQNDLTPDSFDRRQRIGLVIVAIGMLAVGVTAMWIGFSPGMIIGQILLVVGGCLLLLCGVLALTTSLQTKRLFG